MNEYDNATEWLDDIKFQVQLLYNDVYRTMFSSLLKKGRMVGDAQEQSIRFVEETFRLRPGSFHPILNVQDEEF